MTVPDLFTTKTLTYTHNNHQTSYFPPTWVLGVESKALYRHWAIALASIFLFLNLIIKKKKKKEEARNRKSYTRSSEVWHTAGPLRLRKHSVTPWARHKWHKMIREEGQEGWTRETLGSSPKTMGPDYRWEKDLKRKRIYQLLHWPRDLLLVRSMCKKASHKLQHVCLKAFLCNQGTQQLVFNNWRRCSPLTENYPVWCASDPVIRPTWTSSSH